MGFAFNLSVIFADQLMLFLVNLLIARQAGEVLFGDFSVAAGTLLLLGSLITFGVDSIIGYYIPKYIVHNRQVEIPLLMDSLRRFLQPVYLSAIILGMLFSIGLIVASQLIFEWRLFNISHPVFLFFWGSVIISVYNVLLQYFRAVNHLRTTVLLALLQTIFYFTFCLFIYFLFYSENNPDYFPHYMLIGFLLSYLAIVLLCMLIKRNIHFPMHSQNELSQANEWKRKIYGYTLQNLSRFIFSTIPLIIMEIVDSNEHAVGLFSAIILIINLAIAGIEAMGVLIGPEISAALAQNRGVLKRVMRRYISICFLLSFSIVIVFIFASRPILLLYKANFIDALPYTYFCLVNIILYALAMPLTRLIQYSQQGSQIGANITLSLLLFQMLSSFVFISLWGLTGAVFCYVSINLIYYFVVLVIAKRIYHSVLQ